MHFVYMFTAASLSRTDTCFVLFSSSSKRNVKKSDPVDFSAVGLTFFSCYLLNLYSNMSQLLLVDFFFLVGGGIFGLFFA